MIYVRKILAVFSIVFLLFSLVGCVDNKIDTAGGEIELKSQPTLKILYKDNSFEAIRGSFSWTTDNSDGTKTTVKADSSGPTELVKNSTPLQVSPKSTITLNFSNTPENIMVNIWQEDKQIKQTATDSKIITPELKGLVIYEVIATWERGTVCYTFLVDVN